MANSTFSATSLIYLGKGALKKWTNQQIGLYLTTGATPMGSWDASTNTPTITQGSGTVGQYYDVVVAGTWDGTNFLVGDRVIFSAKNKWERVPTGVEQDDIPIVVDFIDENTTALPTQRKSGKSLLAGDSVKVKSTATLPFTCGGITFDSYSDEAVWNGTAWQEQSYSVGKTNEVGVYDPQHESLSGTADYQSDVNKEMLQAINDLNEEYKKAGFSFTVRNETKTDGMKVDTMVVRDKDNNILFEHEFLSAMTGQELANVIAVLPVELQNKTIDCGSFNPQP